MNKVQITFEKSLLKTILLSYGENELADKVDSLTEADILSIGYLAPKYIAQCNLVHQTIACGAVEFFEKASRSLKRKKRIMKFYNS